MRIKIIAQPDSSPDIGNTKAPLKTSRGDNQFYLNA